MSRNYSPKTFLRKMPKEERRTREELGIATYCFLDITHCYLLLEKRCDSTYPAGFLTKLDYHSRPDLSASVEMTKTHI